MEDAKYWHNDPGFILAEKSYLTGRTIYINRHQTKFLVSPTWSAENVKIAYDECITDWAGFEARRPSRELDGFLGRFSSIRDLNDFGRAIDELLAQRIEWGSMRHKRNDWSIGNWLPTDKARIMELMVAFWRHHTIAWPMGPNPFPKQANNTKSLNFGLAELIISAFMATTHGQRRSVMRRTIIPLLLQRIGVRELGDLTASIVRDDLKRIAAIRHRLATRALLSMQRAVYGNERVMDTVYDFVPHSGPVVDEDRFTWVTDQNPAFETWQNYGRATRPLSSQRSIFFSDIFSEIRILRLILGIIWIFMLQTNLPLRLIGAKSIKRRWNFLIGF
jgi:hypothetical protein